MCCGGPSLLVTVCMQAVTADRSPAARCSEALRDVTVAAERGADRVLLVEWRIRKATEGAKSV